MASFVFNIAKGKAAYYASQAGVGNAALVVVPIETAGIESDATLKDYDDLASLLAGTNNEQTTMGRKTITSTTVAPNDTTDVMEADFADLTWTGATGNAISAVIVCFDPDTTGGTDSALIPLTKHDFSITPDGSDVTATVSTFYTAS